MRRGDHSAASSAAPVTIDTSNPAVSAPDLAAASDSGASNADNVTNITLPLFSGTATTLRGDTTRGSLEANVVGSATADGSGNWSITSSALASGVHNLTARATDLAGNQAASAALVVTIYSCGDPFRRLDLTAATRRSPRSAARPMRSRTWWRWRVTPASRSRRDDWMKYGRDMPLLVNMQPAGKYLGERFHRAGGVPAVLCELLRAGKHRRQRADGHGTHPRREHRRPRDSIDREVITTYEEPLQEKAGFLVLKGNLFDFAIMKTSVISRGFPPALSRPAATAFEVPRRGVRRLDRLSRRASTIRRSASTSARSS